MNIKTVQMIDVSDFDTLVEETYGRPYSFQQQDGCKARGTESFTVPSDYDDDFENDTVPEKVNAQDMGVSFNAWLARDPKKALPLEGTYAPSLSLWWGRNFYPSLQVVVNDLHKKGLIPTGSYTIDIDW